jgi:hypothetical protein
MVDLGLLFTSGLYYGSDIDDFEASSSEAEYWLETAADAGHVRAMTNSVWCSEREVQNRSSHGAVMVGTSRCGPARSEEPQRPKTEKGLNPLKVQTYSDVLRHHMVAGTGFEPATSGL